MDTPLSTERLGEERAYMKRFTEDLGHRKVEYPADYATPLEARPRKVQVVNIAVAQPPDIDEGGEEPTQGTSINIIVKSLKPSLTFPVTALLTDSVSDLKALVAKSSTTAPPIEAQRLLLKGKALSDNKLLKEYDLADGATLHLLLKPGTVMSAPSTIEPPQLTISTTLSDSTEPLVVNDVVKMGPAQLSTAAFHATASNPTFWQKLHQLCLSEFATAADADTAFDTFLVSMQGRISANEAAKIRDTVGVDSMGGRV